MVKHGKRGFSFRNAGSANRPARLQGPEAALGGSRVSPPPQALPEACSRHTEPPQASASFPHFMATLMLGIVLLTLPSWIWLKLLSLCLVLLLRTLRDKRANPCARVSYWDIRQLLARDHLTAIFLHSTNTKKKITLLCVTPCIASRQCIALGCTENHPEAARSQLFTSTFLPSHSMENIYLGKGEGIRKQVSKINAAHLVQPPKQGSNVLIHRFNKYSL